MSSQSWRFVVQKNKKKKKKKSQGNLMWEQVHIHGYQAELDYTSSVFVAQSETFSVCNNEKTWERVNNSPSYGQ